MTYLQAIILGALQGLGEFLPISSSGHLIVVPWLLGWKEHSLAFDVALHLGTLVAVVYAFAGDWWRMSGAALRGLKRGRPFAEPGGRIADRRIGTRQAGDISLGVALLIGSAQALALLPGVSRSGITISAALLLGFRRDEAARFSFLLATPITFGAAMLKVPHLLRTGGDAGLVVVGMAVAAIVGWLSIFFLLRYVRTRNYLPFVWYRFAFALIVLSALLLGAHTSS